MTQLNIGRIDYLNIWHVFQLLEETCPNPQFHYVPGHPSQLNSALACGNLDISPSSSFEYLLNAEQYELLPGASISAAREVQSVLFLSPVPLEELGAWMRAHPGTVNLTSASATSTALLKVLWTQKWQLSEPVWQDIEPGLGLASGRPFLEIGNLALQHFINKPSGYHIIDLATEWREWTGLSFVFAVWIVRRNLCDAKQQLLNLLGKHIATIITSLPAEYARLAELPQRPTWLSARALHRYWQAMSYTLTAEEQAGLTMFGKCCSEQGLLPGMPALSWTFS